MMDKKELEKRLQEILVPLREWHEGEDFLRAVQSIATACDKAIVEYAKRGNKNSEAVAMREWKKNLWEEIYPIAHWVVAVRDKNGELHIKWTGGEKGRDAIYQVAGGEEKHLEVTLATTKEIQHNDALRQELIEERGCAPGGNVKIDSEGTKNTRKFGENKPQAERVNIRMSEEDRGIIQKAILDKMEGEYRSGTSLIVVCRDSVFKGYTLRDDSPRGVVFAVPDGKPSYPVRDISYIEEQKVSVEDAMVHDFCLCLPDGAFDKFESVSFVQQGLPYDPPTRQVQHKKIDSQEVTEAAKLPCWIIRPALVR